MTNNIFQPGDQVILRSGGPYMTVESTVNGYVSCSWFLENELQRDSFVEAMLQSREEFVSQRNSRIRSKRVEVKYF